MIHGYVLTVLGAASAVGLLYHSWRWLAVEDATGNGVGWMLLVAAFVLTERDEIGYLTLSASTDEAVSTASLLLLLAGAYLAYTRQSTDPM